MIITHLCGGLGNQMFQYAIGRRLAVERGTSLWLDTYDFGRTPEDWSATRTYRLNHFKIAGRALPPWVCKTFFRAEPGWDIAYRPKRLARLIPPLQEDAPAFDDAALAAATRGYLKGYWQAERYFAPIADVIRADFALAQPMSAYRQSIAARLAGTPSVSIHVRRGDYVTNPTAAAFHGVLGIDWYERALAEMSKVVSEPLHVVFSDDPDWVRAHLPLPPATLFVDPQPDDREYEDLHLMAACRHHVIANSSFSWWGAWLNPSARKTVIAPSRWFLAGDDRADRLPAAWLRL